jgi:hypothetical protein
MNLYVRYISKHQKKQKHKKKKNYVWTLEWLNITH